MTKQEKITALENAMIFTGKEYAKENNVQEDIYILSEKVPQDLHDLIIDLIYRDEQHGADHAYEAMARAIDVIKDNKDDAQFDDNIYELCNDSASIYTSDRLSYLKTNNEYSISQVMKEMSCESIADACAIYFDRLVAEYAQELIGWVNQE